jgi:hypothetical protein
MPHQGKIAIGLLSINGVAIAAYMAHGTDLTSNLCGLSCPLLFIAFIMAVVSAIRPDEIPRPNYWQRFLPVASVFLLPFVSSFVGIWIHDALFDWSFPTYVALVHRIETNEFVVTTNRTRIPPEVAKTRLCDWVTTQIISNVLVVEFDTDVRGFPARSTGCVYISPNTIPSDSYLARKMTRQFQPNWYYFY